MLRGSRLLAAVVVTTAITSTGMLAVSAAHGSDARSGAAAALPAAATVPRPLSTTHLPPVIPPHPPTALVATSVRSGALTLEWTAAVPGLFSINGYEIRISQPFHDVVATENVGNVTSATITNVTPATEYSLSVVARDNAGLRSAPSAGITLVTPATDSGPDTTPPTAPTNLVAAYAEPWGAELTWSPSTDNVGVVGYRIYAYQSGSAPRLIATVPGTSYAGPFISWLQTLPGTRFYVRAVDAAGNVSIASNAVTEITSNPGPSDPPLSPVGCRVTYTTTAQWPGGFVAGVTIANTGPTPITAWTVTFAFGGDQRIASSWSSTFSQTGAVATVGHASWNGVVAPGGSTSVGLQGSWTASSAPPTAFALNGAACAVG